jgi:hypothetical protein
MTNYLGKYKFSPGAASRLAPAGLSASYAELLAETTRPVHALLFTNSLDGDIWLSFDGATGHIWVPSAYSFQLNLAEIDTTLVKSTTIYAKDGDSAPTAGAISVTPIYRE